LQADVALPLIHDCVVGWKTVAVDILQRMLVAGISVDSSADVAARHPELFSGAKQAKKALRREAFTGQYPIRNTHSEMSLESARYRQGGKDPFWQTA
jgi:hypothetical protein